MTQLTEKDLALETLWKYLPCGNFHSVLVPTSYADVHLSFLIKNQHLFGQSCSDTESLMGDYFTPTDVSY